MWQLSAHTRRGSFARVLFRHDVALVGPGDTGPWTPGAWPGRWGRRFVAWMAEAMRVGDIVLLRSGWETFPERVRAVGVVASDYLYLPQFHSVLGWDLQHARRVRWFRFDQPLSLGDLSYRNDVLRLGPVRNPEACERARAAVANVPDDRWAEPLAALPAEEPALAALPPDLAKVAAETANPEALRRRYDVRHTAPSEEEILAHQVVPFLAALGWRPEQLAIGWSYARRQTGELVGAWSGDGADLMAFLDLPRLPEHCRFLVRVKQPGAGVGFAVRDARERLFQMRMTCDVVVTDGFTYRFFRAGDDLRQTACADLSRPRRSAAELFALLRPPSPVS